jgi:hypothetical protein
MGERENVQNRRCQTDANNAAQQTSPTSERMEHAINRLIKKTLRGRGMDMEKDRIATFPFLDTADFFVKKVIQRPKIVPRWIEKQQELMKALSSFSSLWCEIRYVECCT